MKKLILTYAAAVTLIIVCSSFMAVRQPGNKQEPLGSYAIPETITVYFTDEGVTKELDFEEYIKGVVPAEVLKDFNYEAIKAQAVAARTYAYYKYKKFTADPNLYPDEHKTAVVCTDSAHCCAYSSAEKLLETKGQAWMDTYYNNFCNAVDETKGEIMVYEGEPILAVFHASSGNGRTENSGDVWSSDLPYLVSVESPDEDKRAGYVTTVEVDCETFRQKMMEKDPEAALTDDYNTWIGASTLTEGGSVDEIQIGSTAVKGTEMRSLFGLKSAAFEAELLNDRVIFTVQGSGHGVGMSQYGANFMAENGKTYKEILETYYQGAVLAK